MWWWYHIALKTYIQRQGVTAKEVFQIDIMNNLALFHKLSSRFWNQFGTILWYREGDSLYRIWFFHKDELCTLKIETFGSFFCSFFFWLRGNRLRWFHRLWWNAFVYVISLLACFRNVTWNVSISMVFLMRCILASISLYTVNIFCLQIIGICKEIWSRRRTSSVENNFRAKCHGSAFKKGNLKYWHNQETNLDLSPITYHL